eukprot:TRINITY_DN716_c0_g1_i1.p1 TRINITY_DN716_c0_g1~~TRINITY_DN716_c0_g1_i1.p1  ORF type:complete len:351 (-),score=127.78 TRINITY_DN716_c0_g1_i1:215-1267(-)
MGNICGAQQGNTKRSKEIESMLNKNSKIQSEEVKLLLLGPGESGKSTIFKQMKIISLGNGFTEDELKQYRYIVYGNCITQMKVLITAAEKLGYDYENDDNLPRAEKLIGLQSGGDDWSEEVANDIKNLWTDEAVQKAYSKRDKEFQLNDSASYFFENLDRFANPSYVPNEQDVLRARVRSTGIDEAEFEFEDLQFRMLDVGGQRSERRKWIHCFDCVTAVLFCASLSEYDQTLREDDSQNRMKESLLLFDEIVNSPWFRETAFILFLNKQDLFQEKIKRVPLTSCFPEYNGKDTYEGASEFIKNKFLEQNNGPHKIYTHLTCAISTENIQVVFEAVKHTIINDILNDIFF